MVLQDTGLCEVWKSALSVVRHQRMPLQTSAPRKESFTSDKRVLCLMLKQRMRSANHAG